MSFYVFGGASIDIIASSKNKIINYTSNPGKTTFSFGGVARNIADTLSTYSKDVYLVSSFGNDYYSKEMYKDLKNKGIKLNYSKVVEGNGSFYIALEENNNLYVAISDNSIIEDISTKDLDVLSSKIKDEDILIIDANLKEDIIKHILINFKGYKSLKLHQYLNLKGMLHLLLALI